MARIAKPKNSIIYNGPSMIDGKPIIVVAIVESNNSKTGNMVQTLIIRADIAPLKASAMGEDYSVCGNCIHRGKPNPDGKIAANRGCYVSIAQGPTTVYKKATSDNPYPDISADLKAISQLAVGRMVRLGTYGDPAAVPQYVWDNLLEHTEGHTGYSHQWETMPVLHSMLMLSADSKDQAIKAHKMNARTFRVIPIADYQKHGKGALLQNEILCPASAEMGAKVQCNDCKLCSGSSKQGKSIAIVSHGIGKGYVN